MALRANDDLRDSGVVIALGEAVQHVCLALLALLGSVAAPALAHADPILMTSNGSGSATDGSLTASTLFPVPDSSTASRAAESSGIIAFDLSGDPLSGALFNVPTGMDLPAVDRPDTDDVAITNLGLVLAYNLIGSEPQIFQPEFSARKRRRGAKTSDGKGTFGARTGHVVAAGPCRRSGASAPPTRESDAVTANSNQVCVERNWWEPLGASHVGNWLRCNGSGIVIERRSARAVSC